MDIKAGHRISQIKHISDRLLEKILAEKNIDAFNGAQGRILYVLWNENNMTLSEISDKTSLAPTTLTSMTDRMEQSGLVQRLPHKTDRRKTILSLTPKAMDLKKDYDMVSDTMTDIFYEGFSEEEKVQCENMLERILDNLKKYSEDNYSVYQYCLNKFNERQTDMEKNLQEFVAEEVKKLIAAPSCCAEAVEMGNKWLEAVGTDKEHEMNKKLVKELEEDIMPIDGLIAFATSELGAQIFGPERAEEVAKHGEEIKAHGAKYCDCPACQAAEAILSKKDELSK